jgi:hypothetical protein
LSADTAPEALRSGKVYWCRPRPPTKVRAAGSSLIGVVTHTSSEKRDDTTRQGKPAIVTVLLALVVAKPEPERVRRVEPVMEPTGGRMEVMSG